MTSQIGYIDHMQKYVVGVQITPIASEWLYESSVDGQADVPQDFSLYVAMAYSEILPKELEASGYLSFALIKGNLFYPFEIKGDATANVVASVTLTIVAFSALLL